MVHRNDIQFVWRNDRPRLLIQNTGGASLGRCYSASYAEVTSRRPLSMSQVRALREAGFLPDGQEFRVHQVLPDGKLVGLPERVDWRNERDVEPSGYDDVPCVATDPRTGKTLPDVPAINPYSGEPYGSQQMPYYVYHVVARVDSSD